MAKGKLSLRDQLDNAKVWDAQAGVGLLQVRGFITATDR